MNLSQTPTFPVRKYLLPLVALTLLLAIAMVYTGNASMRERRLAEVAERGVEVMPFDLDQTTHYFESTEIGGVQTVTANNLTNQEQVRLVRLHVQEEADKFRQGDFSDPAAIHGETMPGLAALRAGTGEIQVVYREVPGGAQLTYTSSDLALVEALHAWFAAQRSDHGGHAEPGMQHGANP